MMQIDRVTWWSWSDQRRESWSDWFRAHGYPPENLAEFWIYEDEHTVTARVYTDRPNSADAELVNISMVDVPPYH